MTTLHLAQVNIARLKAPEGDPLVQDFFDNIERINALAEKSPGFVWRYEGIYGDDPLLVFNLSVWESTEDLAAFVFRSAHVHIMRRKHEWMQPMQTAHTALWWIASNTRPTPEEAMQKLTLLNDNGPSAAAFTFSQRFAASDTQ